MAEVALSTTLVVVAGVLTISFARGLGFDRGFDPSGLVTVSVDQPNDHADAAAMRAFYEGLATDLSRLPAVAGVAFSSQSPLSAVGLRPPLVVNGQPAPSQRYRAVVHFVSPEYFDVIGMTMRSGRAWTSTGSPDDTRQVVVNEAFVRQFLPDTDPLTTRLEFFRVPFLVGGVVSNLHPDPADAPPAIVYVSHRAFGLPSMTMVLRTTGDTTALLPTLRQLIWNHAPASPLDDLAPVEWRIGEALAAPRFGATLVGGFAALALVLASLGIYGVLAFSVTRRSREIGIRRALGATNASVMGLIARDGLTLVLIGILIGTLGATLVTQAIAHTLIDVGRLDALSFGGGIALMLLVSGLACWIPARAASRFDPVAALRAE